MAHSIEPRAGAATSSLLLKALFRQPPVPAGPALSAQRTAVRLGERNKSARNSNSSAERYIRPIAGIPSAAPCPELKSVRLGRSLRRLTCKSFWGRRPKPAPRGDGGDRVLAATPRCVAVRGSRVVTSALR